MRESTQQSIHQEPSVCAYCTAYNHEAYIRQTLDGFVEQQTDFPLRVIVHDDASTDGTADIIREYEEKYPDLFTCIYQKENQYSQGISVSKKYIYPLITEKYVAICEGDDYWCDPNKLQRQVDYIETHPECSMVVHETMAIDERTGTAHLINGSIRPVKYKTEDLIKHGGIVELFQTSSYLLRKEVCCDRPDAFWFRTIGDWPMSCYAGHVGYIYYIPEIMSCYRQNTPGSWSVRVYSDPREHLRQAKLMYDEQKKMLKALGPAYKPAFERILLRNEFHRAFKEKKYYRLLKPKYFPVGIENLKSKIKDKL